MRCAFLTMDSMDGFVTDDELAVPFLEELGWSVEMVPWRRPGTDWDAFDLVVLRTTWDYPEDPTLLLERLEEIDRSTRLENSLDIVRWNLRKTYLRDLEERGVPVVPTAFEKRVDPVRLWAFFDHLNSDEIIVKPVVGANAVDTFRLNRQVTFGELRAVERRLQGREFMVQPFMAGVIEEGEYALLYIGGEYSHSILKSPAEGDFRVQEEHGGVIQAVEPEPELVAAGKRALEAVSPDPFYARVDLVRDAVGQFVVMELELIEPSLYLRMDPGAPGRFARAVDRLGRAV